MGLFIRKRKDGSMLVSSSSDHSAPPPAKHNFATKWVNARLVEGLASMGKGKLVLHAADGDVEYEIKRPPGAYCTHCGDRVADGPARSAKDVESRKDFVNSCQVKKSPEDSGDPKLPDGGWYEVNDFYDCELVS